MSNKKLLPGLLALAGGIGALASVYFAIKETPEANKAVEEEAARREEAEEDEMTKKDEIIVMAPHYKKTAIITVGTVACIAGSYISGALAIGALATTAYAWKKKYIDAEHLLNKISPEVRKKLHLEEATKKVQEKVEKGKMPKEPKKKLFQKDHDELFPVYEENSDQIIWTTKNRILQAENYIARAIGGGRWASLANVITLLGGKATDDVKDLGWSVNDEEQCEYFYSSEEGVFVDIILHTINEDSLFDKETLLLYFSVPPIISDEKYA